MAKSPRKSANGAAKTVSHIPSHSKGSRPRIGGKNFKVLNKQYNPTRRFSIVSTSSSDSDSNQNKRYNSDSDDSSLTAVSDGGNRASKSVSSFANYESNKSTASKRNRASRKTTSKAKKTYAKKRIPKKTVDWDPKIYQNYESSDSSEEEIDLGNLYSMMENPKNSKQSNRYYDNDDNDDSNSEEEDEEEDAEEVEDEEEEENDFSSSDDSDVDFVKLQAERKAKSMKNVKAMKRVPRDRNLEPKYSSSEESEDEVIEPPKPKPKARRSSSVSKAKFGRRRSDAVLPEDINFTFEFDDMNKFDSNAIIDEEDISLEADSDNLNDNQEEDIGEEVYFSDTELKLPNPAEKDGENSFNFDFDIQVPRINEDEINSDDDYEIDDNELLATLQADNDLDEFVGGNMNNSHVRNSSIGSYGDEEENDPFLQEEEKFLVNEFENNGFDDDDHIDIEDIEWSDSSNRNDLIKSFNNMTGDAKKQVVQYASDGSRSGSELESDSNEDEEDDYIDLINFNVPLFDDNEIPKKKYTSNNTSDDRVDSSQSKKKKKSKNGVRKGILTSEDDDEDDSYLWNYFFSSDNGNSSGEEQENEEAQDGSFDQLLMEELFNEMDKEESMKKRSRSVSKKKMNLGVDDEIGYEDEEQDYNSGESTDVDLSLPVSATKNNSGSKMAKEVLSSKTADYRPPVLGTWVTIDSQPFGIIDGLSTRTLSKADNKSKPRKSVVLPHNVTSDDLALGLDELLNISELDDADENEIKIWRDFSNQKKRVPLGAFRNKSILQHTPVEPDNFTSRYSYTSKSNNDLNRRRFSMSGHPTAPPPRRNSLKSNGIKKPAKLARRNSSVTLPNIENITPGQTIPSKLKRRRASIVEAVSEGYRPTKSGLFSENALADVEEVLGEDTDLMALIKSL